MAKKVLVVDDEKLIVKGIRFSLEQDGMEVDCAYDGEEALNMAKANEYDMILLDIMLPKMDGFEVCQAIREFSDMPIVMLTAKGDDMDKILGLDYGADDYITKPFNILEVKARIKAIMRRTAGPREKKEVSSIVEKGDLRLDCDSRRLFISGREVNLTAKEFDLLELLVKNENKVYSRENLLGLVWGKDYPGDVRTVDVHVRRLREKIETNPSEPKYVHTKWGVGYYYYQKLTRRQKGFSMQKSKQFLQFLKSLKFRLILLIVVIAVVPSLILSAAVLKYYEKRAVSIRESEILSQAKILANQIATSEYMKLGADVSSSNIQTQIDMLTTIYDGRVIVVDDNCKVYYDTYNLDDHKLIIAEEVMRSFKGEDIVHYDSENHYIEMTIPISDPDDKSETVIGVMLISVSTDNIVINQSYMRQVAVIVMVMVGIAIVFFAILLLLYFLKPLQKIEEGIAAIKNGYGEYNLQVNDYTETAGICEKINQMLGRIKVMDDSRQEFVSNVSHELKTPLTSMKVLADSINSMPDAPKELYQEFMEDITNEIERETKIINDLLSLVKMDKSAAGLNVSSVNINELLEQILKRLQPIADKQKVELVLESFRPVTAEVDEVKITLAITNLVENAIKYNRNDGEGWVHVSLNADHQYFYLKVEDSGIGIPEESLDHIYERFYRVDKSHSREIGGTGLGLAITRNSILMHRGAIKVHSVMGEGTTFDVRIPLNYIA